MPNLAVSDKSMLIALELAKNSGKNFDLILTIGDVIAIFRHITK